MDKGQEGRYSQDELALITKLFQNNEPRLLALRNVFWQFPLTAEQAELVKFNEEELAVIKKEFLPEENPDSPLGLQSGMYSLLYSKIRGLNPLMGLPDIKANDLLIQYVEQQFSQLTDKKQEQLLTLKDLPKDLGIDRDEERFTNVLAFSNITAYIEGHTKNLKALSTPPVELTPEEQKKRDTTNSSK